MVVPMCRCQLSPTKQSGTIKSFGILLVFFNSLCFVAESDEDEYEYVPPDGGWGWLVLGGSVLVSLLIPGTIKSFGILFVEFIEVFHASPVSASWIPALTYFLYCSLGQYTYLLHGLTLSHIMLYLFYLVLYNMYIKLSFNELCLHQGF